VRVARPFCVSVPPPHPNFQDPEKLRARAERFGTSAPQKRAAPAEPVDAEEAERRRKRAERFGT